MTDIMIKKTIYEFNELTEDAKNRALNEEIKFLIEFTNFEELDSDMAIYPNLKTAFEKCEKNRTPWFLGNFIFEYCGKYISETLQSLYYFEKNGVVFGVKEDVNVEYGLNK